MGRGLRLIHRLANPLVLGVLRSPAHRPLSGTLAVLSVTGRRTGRVHRRPVMWAPVDGATVVVMVGMPDQKVWWRNLRGGAAVGVRLRGRDRRARGTVVTGDAALRDAWARRFPRAARRMPADPVMVRLDLEGPAAA